MSGRPAPLVWITRPQPGAAKTAAVLSGAGYEPFTLPLTEIRSCDPGISTEDARGFDSVVVTSANAIRHAPDALVEALKDKPVYAVGDATAGEARERGFSAVLSAGGAVDELVKLVTGTEKPGAAMLYLAGRRRAGDLEGKLAKKGFHCGVGEVYLAEIVSYPTDYLADAINRHAPDAVLLHSALAAQAFSRSVFPEHTQAFEKTKFFIMSKRIAAALPPALGERAIVASAPTDGALLAALQAALPASAI